MSRFTPTINRWSSQTIDDEHSQLDANAETRSVVAKLPARAVIFKKTPNEPVPFGHRWKPWLQVLAIWILFADSWGLPSANGTFQTCYTQTLLSDYKPGQLRVSVLCSSSFAHRIVSQLASR